MKRLLLTASLALAACGAVKPWQRELLALPAMQLDADAHEQHVLESREGASGGYGSVGTGCGCN
jgi:hypothetical protein